LTKPVESLIKAEKPKTMVIEKRIEKPLSINIQEEAIEEVCLPWRANKRRWLQRKRHTKKNWTHFTGIWNDDPIYGRANNDQKKPR